MSRESYSSSSKIYRPILGRSFAISDRSKWLIKPIRVISKSRTPEAVPSPDGR